MASETVNVILSAEQEYDKKIQAASEKAAAVIAEAEKRAEELIEKAVSDAKAKAHTIIAEAEKKAGTIGSVETSAAVNVDKNSAKYKQAVEAVIARSLE